MLKKKSVLLIVFSLVFFLCLSGCVENNKKKNSSDDNNLDDNNTVNQSDNNTSLESYEIIAPGIPGSVPIITVDDFDNPHIIFYETNNKDLYYAKLTKDNWSYVTIDSEGDIGDGHDIVVDSKDVVHVCYRDKTHGSVKYAKKEEGNWENVIIEDPSDENESVESSSIALKSDGYPFVMYNIQSNNKPAYLKYAFWDGENWNVTNPHITGHWVSLTLDQDDIPHIAFHDSGSSKVCYAKQYTHGNNSGWNIDTIDSDSNFTVVNDPHIMLDSQGDPYIVYRDNSSEGSIKMATLTSGEWSIEKIDENVGITDELSFTIEDDISYVVYGNTNNNSLMLAKKINNKWVFEKLGEAHVCSVAVDSLKHVHIAHTYGADIGEIIKYKLIE